MDVYMNKENKHEALTISWSRKVRGPARYENARHLLVWVYQRTVCAFVCSLSVWEDIFTLESRDIFLAAMINQMWDK